MEYPGPISLLFMLPFLVLASAGTYVIPEGSDEDNEYWAKREEDAKRVSDELYVPNPFAVTSSFNAAVHK